MKIIHKGYELTGLVGGMSAKITERNTGTESGSWLEIELRDLAEGRTYDLNGLADLVKDLNTVLDLAERADAANAPGRADS